MLRYLSIVCVLQVGLIQQTNSLVAPRAIDWSSKSYGPDGPWQAVTVQLGTPFQQVDLLPGGSWMSNVLSSSICSNSPLSLSCAAPGGTYNISASSTSNSTAETSYFQNSSFVSTTGALPLFGSAKFITDLARFPNTNPTIGPVDLQSFDLLVISEGYQTLPDGTPYSIEVGNLALGAQDVNQTWSRADQSPWNATLLPSYLSALGQTPSNSYGMHIGSTTLGIPGSLYMGGYDQSRVLGQVSTQRYGADYLPIDLLDIGIGVVDGQSPFNYTSKSGLLTQGNSSIGASLSVHVEATVPYLYLPQSTCAAIAEDLPVTYSEKYGLYFWNTLDPNYANIITSPTYLSFAFRLNGSVSQNVSINVPFALLNLTLSPPFIGTPTAYFPCSPFTSQKAVGNYALGRAFLQAAFVGVNWEANHAGVWWLAQAPGPNTPSLPVVMSIHPTDNYIVPSASTWSDTWKGIWKDLSTPTTSPATTATISATTATVSTTIPASTSTSGILTGTIIAIAIISAVVCASTIVVGVCHVRRRRARQRSSTFPAHDSSSELRTIDDSSAWDKRYLNGGFGPGELDNISEPAELAWDSRYIGYMPKEVNGFREPIEMP